MNRHFPPRLILFLFSLSLRTVFYSSFALTGTIQSNASRYAYTQMHDYVWVKWTLAGKHWSRSNQGMYLWRECVWTCAMLLDAAQETNCHHCACNGSLNLEKKRLRKKQLNYCKDNGTGFISDVSSNSGRIYRPLSNTKFWQTGNEFLWLMMHGREFSNMENVEGKKKIINNHLGRWYIQQACPKNVPRL